MARIAVALLAISLAAALASFAWAAQPRVVSADADSYNWQISGSGSAIVAYADATSEFLFAGTDAGTGCTQDGTTARCPRLSGTVDHIDIAVDDGVTGVSIEPVSSLPVPIRV